MDQKNTSTTNNERNICSNLVPTAVEFIPRAHRNVYQESYYQQNSNHINTDGWQGASYESTQFVRPSCQTEKINREEEKDDSRHRDNGNYNHQHGLMELDQRSHREWQDLRHSSQCYSNGFETYNQVEYPQKRHGRRNWDGSGCSSSTDNFTHSDDGDYDMPLQHNRRNLQRSRKYDQNFVAQECQFKNNSSRWKKASNNYHSNSGKFISTENGNFSPESDSNCQRDRLIMQLNRGTHECLICCEVIKQREPTWNCSNCYYVLHMWCVIKWARSSAAESNIWRCPACQSEFSVVPEKYMCFCGKTKLQTEWNRTDTAHSCGEVCGRIRENPTPWFVCEHKCTLLCHPGPCPSCTMLVLRECGCGRTKRNIQCSTKTDIFCGAICNRILNCSAHCCTKTCHFGDCGSCTAKKEIKCFCGKQNKNVVCGQNLECSFACENKCGRILSCGNHKCDEQCHPGECGLCPRDPLVLTTCMCGKMPVAQGTRTLCLDNIPLCDEICGKLLKCGPPNKRHTCEQKCHEGDCNICDKKTKAKCRCGALEKVIPCSLLNSNDRLFKCDKKCSKKRTCGKHKCNQVCCIDEEHICSVKCNQSLSCGKHKCDLLCHRGKCGRCLQSSFEELFCHCGHSVIYPPVPCGTKPPACDQPCKRQHDCDHPPLHFCHSDRECPPCSVLTEKLCHGEHELRKTIPCYQKEFSCGLPCGVRLPCGVHYCQQPCHPGKCLALSKVCTQPCSKPRDLCGHRCGAPCHIGDCPETKCYEMVKVTCACSNIVANHPCYEHTDDYKRIVASTLASKLSEMQVNNSVNVVDTNEKITAQIVNLRTLDCSDECKLIMRNRRLALALQIQNPDMNSKLSPKFSDFLKSWAKKDPQLCQHVHEKLTALVKLAKDSKQKSRSFSFEVMNKEKRQVVHEYCAHFGCDSEAYDSAPKRNVVAIATKGKCWLPACSLLEAVQRDMGHRKVPGPIINKRVGSKDDSQPSASRIIFPVTKNAHFSNSGINYYGD